MTKDLAILVNRNQKYLTTNEFLDYFGLEKLSELPDLPEIKEPQNLSLDLEPDIANDINQVSSDQLN